MYKAVAVLIVGFVAYEIFKFKRMGISSAELDDRSYRGKG